MVIDLDYSVKTITGPTTWVASALDVRSWGRIPSDDTTEDTMILTEIKAATAVMETLIDRIFCTQTLEMRLDEFPWGTCIQLPKGPWQSVLSVKYYDLITEVLTTLSSSNYVFEETTGIIMLDQGSVWPNTQVRPGAVQIQFKAGYGDAATDPPPICKQAVICGVLDELENRHGRFEIPAGVRQKLRALWPGTL